MTGADAIAIIILLTILIAVGVYLLHWLYRHSSKDQSFVRTGAGGEKVVMGGGALVIPIIHDITVVNMNAIPIEVRRTGEQSLITKNKMRIDLVAEYFVRVIATRDGVSTAARTLGAQTQNALAVKEVIHGRFVDAMAAVAARMTMEEIHQDRGGYIRQAAELAAGTLESNGLELENASLTSLNQSDIGVFNPSNAFDAEGLTQLTEQVEDRRKLRNKIENEARIDIKMRDFEAEQRALEIDRDLEIARINQVRDIENRKAMQLAEVAAERSSSEIAVVEAKLKADKESELLRITKEQAIELERIRSQNHIRTQEIEKQRETELVDIETHSTLETERIHSRQQIEAERIERERQIREASIRSQMEIEVFDSQSHSEVEKARLDREREVEAERISKERQIELLGVEAEKEVRVSSEQAAGEQERAAISKRLDVEMARLQTDQEVSERDIARQQAIKLAETGSFRNTEDAAISANRALEEMRIAARKFIDRFEIEQDMQIEIADKERLIAVINKQIEEAVALTSEAEARRSLAATEARIDSVRAEEIAARNKRIEIIDAEAKVEREYMRLVRNAEGHKVAMERRAEAEIAESKAAEVRYQTDADGHRKLNEAENMRTDESRRSAIYEHLVRTLPEVIRESVRPMENIESIKILQVDGLPGLNSPSEGAGGLAGSGSDNVSDRVVNSAMKYRTQVAFVDGLMEEIGLPLKNLGSAGGMSFRNFPESAPKNTHGDDT